MRLVQRNGIKVDIVMDVWFGPVIIQLFSFGKIIHGYDVARGLVKLAENDNETDKEDELGLEDHPLTTKILQA